VLFDEAHQQAWSTRPTVAAVMQPAHPADSSYAAAAEALRSHDFDVAILETGLIDSGSLAGCDVLVLPHLSSPKYEVTTAVGSPIYTSDELAAIREFVGNGGGLVVLAESEQDKYGNNLADVASMFGITVEHRSVQDYSTHHQAPSWIHGVPSDSRSTHPILKGVAETVFYRAGSLTVQPDADAVVVLTTTASASASHAPLLAAASYGAGRVVVFADSDLFGDDCIDAFDHRQLWLNTLYFCAYPSFAASSPLLPSAVAASGEWKRLKAATDRLRLLQNPDGSVDLTSVEAATVDKLVAEMTIEIDNLRASFQHEGQYLEAVTNDLRRWSDAGYGKPDFGPSLALFRPERDRRDGIEHLVVFPMYTPNGSLDVRFEALVVRVPWPEWIDELERNQFDNAKFVPVHLVDNTAGYDSECAVLFPETVSVDGPAANHFGGIFCDREAERYRRVAGRAIETTGLQLPPDIAALLSSEPMTQDMFELWDLIHDRAHSHGELPFDPFMIRQRLPFWMYSLEELRCDLTACHEAAKLEDEFPFARYVQFGVLFDRLFRFPVTGSRVRNYDGLAGQILFGFLHSEGVLTWRDNTLLIDWDVLPEAINRLRLEIEQLYRAGISSTKVRYWIAAHDLVSRYVQPNLASNWVPDRRADRDEADHKAWVTMVHPDEFPLSMFYQSLQGKLAPFVEREVAA